MAMLETAGRLGAATLLGLGLSACIDARIEIDVLSETTARATVTQDMGADFYAMVKMSAEESDAASEDTFCAEGKLTEHEDGSATCVIAKEGPFASLDLGDGEESITFTSAGPGLVRVSLPTADMKEEIGADDAAMDEETKAMIEAFFAGRSITIHVGGAGIEDTNMALADDKRSAETSIPFLDLIEGKADLPDELYAVVRVP